MLTTICHLLNSGLPRGVEASLKRELNSALLQLVPSSIRFSQSDFFVLSFGDCLLDNNHTAFQMPQLLCRLANN